MLKDDIQSIVKYPLGEWTVIGWDASLPSQDLPDQSVASNEEPMCGCAFLVEERRPKESLEICKKYVSEGAKLLIISRDPPSELLSGVAIVPERTIWLTFLSGKDRMNPTSIGVVMSEIKRFIEHSNSRAVVLIDGLEYLISLNTFNLMFQFTNQLRDMFVTSGAILIMPIDMRTLDDREQALLERDFQIITPAVTIGEGTAQENLLHITAGDSFRT